MALHRIHHDAWVPPDLSLLAVALFGMPHASAAWLGAVGKLEWHVVVCCGLCGLDSVMTTQLYVQHEQARDLCPFSLCGPPLVCRSANRQVL